MRLKIHSLEDILSNSCEGDIKQLKIQEMKFQEEIEFLRKRTWRDEESTSAGLSMEEREGTYRVESEARGLKVRIKEC